jgi:flagellar basal-body rod modification protein FlgD
MPITGITPSQSITGAGQAGSAATVKNDSLGQDAFLQLLLAQLKNQDPFKPMEDRDFVAQLAQLNSLNQLTEMNATLTQLSSSQTLAQASALIGKTVTGLTTLGSQVTGVVAGLRLVDSKVMLNVDGMTVPFDTILEVSQPEPEPVTPPTT